MRDKRGSAALRAVAGASVLLVALGASHEAAALGLGRLAVQSALGEPLHAEIDVSSLTPEEAATLKLHIASPETYRNAGVDYNAALAVANVSLQRRPDGRAFLQVTSDRVVQEPFVDVILELDWASGKLVREFTLLIDPPSTRAAAPVAPASPVAIGPAPQPAGSSATAPSAAGQTAASPQAATPSPAATPPTGDAPRPSSLAVRPASPPASASAALGTPAARRPAPVAAAPAETPASGAASTAANDYRVQRGDTLYRIATRLQRPGVSLDQMLVALYRNNGEAFVDNNMNRLKAGSVLSVPSAEQAAAVAPGEARQVIQAQSADFGSYREKLAASVRTAPAEQAGRSAGGQVQAEVQDRRAPAATPDKLTLSKGSAASAAKPGTEEQVARSREQKDNATRVAELAKNVKELSELRGAAVAASGAPAGAKAGSPSSAGLPLPGVATAPTDRPSATAQPSTAGAPLAAAASAAAAAPASAPPTAAAPAAVATASAPTAVAVASAPAAEPVAAPASAVTPPTRVAADAPASAAPAAAQAPAGSTALDLLDNPWLLPAGGLLVALLAAFGVYRLRQRKRDGGETSFLESRLQPDSFFGASGGQRVDTRDATGVPSSMSYSLSQLDAIGDVDPVAEADVYLAYGRDLQAEEILKEAMRTSPDRLAIRLKLLEVYAKRRDTKGYELLATQLHALTNGQGDDWLHVQEQGLSIDPDNALYQPDGRPAAPARGEHGGLAETLGATTMPATLLPSPSRFEEQRLEFDTPQASPSIDLDLDALGEPRHDDLPDLSTPAEPPAPAVTGSSFESVFGPLAGGSPAADGAAADVAPATGSTAFDFELPSFDFDTPQAPAPAAAPSIEAVEPSAAGPVEALFDVPLGDEVDEALERKIELAEEFRQIGDLEGARDLLQEVMTQTDGNLGAKARRMLAEIG